MTKATDMIAAERQRQITAEGWTPEHDGQHVGGELVEAAVMYARYGTGRSHGGGQRRYPAGEPPSEWPWDLEWWKPTPGDPVRALVKAGALIAAEIDRRLRGHADIPDPVTPADGPHPGPRVLREGEVAVAREEWERAHRTANAASEAAALLGCEVGELVERVRGLVEVASAEVSPNAIYHGNSVEHWRVKSRAYGDIVHGCKPALERAGFRIGTGSGEMTIAAAVDALASRAAARGALPPPEGWECGICGASRGSVWPCTAVGCPNPRGPDVTAPEDPEAGRFEWYGEPGEPSGLVDHKRKRIAGSVDASARWIAQGWAAGRAPTEQAARRVVETIAGWADGEK